MGSQERLLHRELRSVYLITCSQADLDKRDSFARTVVQAFDETRSGFVVKSGIFLQEERITTWR